ncbi:hypothetical protein [Microbacterium allomyrinae]|uniref:Uncharacterized protein n=1 Tax=Microbacterium allomyrinae TaxID=2830666 RepID=A0A9X1LVY3_9MICO|nr:hypothetical protein [Microbacterium allomyrinae]MCC2033079.1 hypothetical protein [Microbacterium allomyrinae]
MSTAARKARKRAGIPHVKPPKKRTRVDHQAKGLGLTTMPEIIFGLVIRGNQ